MLKIFCLFTGCLLSSLATWAVPPRECSLFSPETGTGSSAFVAAHPVEGGQKIQVRILKPTLKQPGIPYTPDQYLALALEAFPYLTDALEFRDLGEGLFEYPDIDRANYAMQFWQGSWLESAFHFVPFTPKKNKDPDLYFAELWAAGKVPYKEGGDNQFEWLATRSLAALALPKKTVKASQGLMYFWLSCYEDPILNKNAKFKGYALRQIKRLTTEIASATRVLFEAGLSLKYPKVLAPTRSRFAYFTEAIFPHPEFRFPLPFIRHLTPEPWSAKFISLKIKADAQDHELPFRLTDLQWEEFDRLTQVASNDGISMNDQLALLEDLFTRTHGPRVVDWRTL